LRDSEKGEGEKNEGLWGADEEPLPLVCLQRKEKKKGDTRRPSRGEKRKKKKGKKNGRAVKADQTNAGGQASRLPWQREKEKERARRVVPCRKKKRKKGGKGVRPACNELRQAKKSGGFLTIVEEGKKKKGDLAKRRGKKRGKKIHHAPR